MPCCASHSKHCPQGRGERKLGLLSLHDLLKNPVFLSPQICTYSATTPHTTTSTSWCAAPAIRPSSHRFSRRTAVSGPPRPRRRPSPAPPPDGVRPPRPGSGRAPRLCPRSQGKGFRSWSPSRSHSALSERTRENLPLAGGKWDRSEAVPQLCAGLPGRSWEGGSGRSMEGQLLQPEIPEMGGQIESAGVYPRRGWS